MADTVSRCILEFDQSRQQLSDRQDIKQIIGNISNFLTLLHFEWQDEK
jgi:hypothetical protein